MIHDDRSRANPDEAKFAALREAQREAQRSGLYRRQTDLLTNSGEGHLAVPLQGLQDLQVCGVELKLFTITEFH